MPMTAKAIKAPMRTYTAKKLEKNKRLCAPSPNGQTNEPLPGLVQVDSSTCCVASAGAQRTCCTPCAPQEYEYAPRKKTATGSTRAQSVATRIVRVPTMRRLTIELSGAHAAV